MKDVKVVQLARRKKESRDIVRQILDYGVTEAQKIDIMFELAMNLESNKAMQEITKLLKKFRENINKEEAVDNNINSENKILT